jgi:hypothetical protein
VRSRQAREALGADDHFVAVVVDVVHLDRAVVLQAIAIEMDSSRKARTLGFELLRERCLDFAPRHAWIPRRPVGDEERGEYD